MIGLANDPLLPPVPIEEPNRLEHSMSTWRYRNIRTYIDLLNSPKGQNYSIFNTRLLDDVVTKNTVLETSKSHKGCV